MANPYENAGDIDPFQEPQSHSVHNSPVTLTYTMPSGMSGSPVEQTRPSVAPTSYMNAPPTAPQSYLPPPPSYSMPENPQTVPAQPEASPSICSMAYYQAYFDVTTRQVLNRMTNALLPICPPDFLHGRNWHITEVEPTMGGDAESPAGDHNLVVAGVQLSRTPDLYGPFWICTLLWVTLGVVGNAMSRIAYARDYTNNASSRDKWSFDFALIPAACATIYLYCFLFGSVVWGVMKWKYLPVTLVDMLCLYGYSMFAFVLVALLCAVPVSAFQWVVVLLGGVWSAAYLVVNLWHMLKQHLSSEWFMGIVGGVVLGHMLLTISFKLYFLHYKN